MTVSRDDDAAAVAERVRTLLLPTIDETIHRFERWRRTRVECIARRRLAVDRLRRTCRLANVVWLAIGDAPILTFGRSVTVRIEDENAITVTCQGLDLETAEQIVMRAGAARRTSEPAAAGVNEAGANRCTGGRR